MTSEPSQPTNWQMVIAVARVMSRIVPSTRYASYNFDAFAPTTRKNAAALATTKRYAKGYPALNQEAAQNLILSGPPGCGKTLLGASTLRQFVADDIENGEESTHRFTAHVELLAEWRRVSGRRTGSGEETFFREYSKRGQLLVLDDLRAPRSTEEADALDWLVELRYRQECCPTIVTTNLNLADLKLALGDRSFDRLREGALLALMDGASHRARFAWDGPPAEDEQ